MGSKSYDIVLLPEQSLNEKAVQLSKKLAGLDCYFTLDNENFFPHLSLYMLQLSESGLRKAEELIEQIAQDTRKIKTAVKNYNHEDGYVDVEYVKTPELVDLQTKVIHILNPVREGLREKDKIRLETTTGEEHSNILTYGYRSVGNLFYPHMTFTRFKGNRDDSLDSFPPLDSFIGEYIELGIFELGENGTCIRKIKTWKL